MHKFHLNVNTIDKVKEFVQVAGKQNFDISVTAPGHPAVVAGGSILGVFSLPLTSGIDVLVSDYTKEMLLRSALPNNV